jgi:hypothetical protein
MHNVVDPAAVQGDRTVPRFGVHPDLAPNHPSKLPRGKGPIAFVVSAEAAL